MEEAGKGAMDRNLGKKSHKCRLCGAEGMFDTYLVQEMMQDSREEFEYFVCAECNCLQIAEIPSDLGKYYGRDYYSFEQEELPDFYYETPVVYQDKILDVGCGSGEWLFKNAKAGHTNLYGCDPFLEKDLHYGDRVHIRNCAIHEMEENASFDIVRMADSFEHMTDPLEVMLSAARLLKPGGWLAMDIPVFPNAAFDIFGAYWYQIDAPRHIFLHSKESLEYLEKHSGLKIMKMEYNAEKEMVIRSFLYSMGVPFYEQTMKLALQYFTREDIKEMEQMINDLNQTGYSDHAQIFWRKP